MKEYNYDINKISNFISTKLKERLTNDFIDDMHTSMGAGASNYPKTRDQLVSLMDDKFLDDLYYYLTSTESQL